MAPADGIVSRRMARVGGYRGTAVGEPMFRIVANSEVELDAEVTETRIARVQDGPAGARRGRRPRHHRRHRAPRLARGRQGDPARPRAHLPRRQPRPARRRVRAAAHRDGQRPRPRRSRLRHPLRAATAPSCRSCATAASRRAAVKTGLAAGALVEVRRRPERRRSRRRALRHLPARWRRRAPSVARRRAKARARR